jgi:hypothetical protein
MTDGIQFKGWITFDDTVRVERILFPKSGSVSHKIVMAFGIAAIATIILSTGVPWSAKALTLIMTAGIVGGTWWYMQHASHSAQVKAYKKATATDRHGVVSQESIEFISANTKSDIKWNYFSRVEEYENLIVLAKDSYYVAFAPYLFNSEDDWEKCKKVITEKKSLIQPAPRPA